MHSRVFPLTFAILGLLVIQVWKNVLHFWHLPDLTHLLREVIVESLTLIVILIKLLLHFLYLFLFRADLHFLSLIQTVVGLAVHVSLYYCCSAFLGLNRVHFCSCPHKFLISRVNLFWIVACDVLCRSHWFSCILCNCRCNWFRGRIKVWRNLIIS